LVSRTDAEEQVIMLSDLRKKVEDLKMENEYQLRLKDMNCNEKIKEVTGKLLQEIDSLKMATALIKSEKEKEENRFTEDINQEKLKHMNEINVIFIKYYWIYIKLFYYFYKINLYENFFFVD